MLFQVISVVGRTDDNNIIVFFNIITIITITIIINCNWTIHVVVKGCAENAAAKPSRIKKPQGLHNLASVQSF